MRYIGFRWLCMCASVMLISCSQTKNMPEGEILYKGIKEISYGKKARCVPQDEETGQQEGVITAVANAVDAIDAALRGRTDITQTLVSMEKQQKDKALTRTQRDSVKAELEVMSLAYETTKEEVDAALACAPNGSIMGSSSIVSPWPWGLHVYNYFSDSKTIVGKWIFNTFGHSPVYLSTVNPRTRVLVAKNVLRNHGFFNADVEYDILPQKDTLKAKIAYSVYPRELYRLDQIDYLNFPVCLDTLVQKGRDASLLVSGHAFNVANLDAERTRLSTIVRNKGFYNFRPDYITFKADTIQRKGWVQLHVEPVPGMPAEATRRYVVGHTDITLFKYDDFDIVDSVMPRPRTDSTPTTIRKPSKRRVIPRVRDVKMRYSGKPGVQPLRLSELRKYLFYREGQPFNQTVMTFVRDRISQMGVFSQSQMTFTPRAALNPDSPDTLDVSIFAILDKPFDSELSANVVSKSNGLIGPGLSYSISKRNAFRRAETMKFKVYGSYEWQTGAQPTGNNKSLNNYEVGGQLSLNYPRLILPEGRRLSRQARTSTDFALDVSWMRRAGYYTMAQFKGDMTYKYQSRPYTAHSFTPLSVKFTSLMERTSDFNEVLRRSPAMEVSMRDQVVPAMEYTITMTSRRTAHNPRAMTLTVKQAGNLTNAIFTACGRDWNEQNKQILGVPFAQFAKATAEFKDEFRRSHGRSIVARLGIGAVYSYGNSTSAPYSDLFSVGGANSIRAFCLRGVGPGRYNPANSGYSYIDQVGDFKIELNAEFRFPLVGSLNGALFVDAGNVWLKKEDPNRPGSGFSLRHLGNDLALGTGFGVRYDLSFLVMRFDVGVGIHAPYDTGRKGYYNMPRFWDSLGFHLAVGYPF